MQTSTYVLIVGLSVTVLSASAVQADEPLAVQASKAISVSASGLYLNYRELKGSPRYVPDRAKGWSKGFAVEWSDVIHWNSPSVMYLNASYEHNGGSVTHYDYDETGAFQNQLKSPLRIDDLSGEFGTVFRLGDKGILPFFVQLEWRRWHRVLDPHFIDEVEDYTYLAPGLGLRGTYPLSDHWLLNWKGAVTHMVAADWAASGNPAMEANPTSPSLGTRFVEQAGVGLDYVVTRRLSIKWQASYSHLSFGHSDPVCCYVMDGKRLKHQEPDSITDQPSVQLGVAWMY